ncbi:MAG: ribbon-helix-helix domain-containing protein [Anaerolineaceae bacterium]
MDRTQILLEPELHKKLKLIAHQEKRSLSDLIREMLEKQIVERQRFALVSAARALLADYQTDSELTAFTVLDGEDFNA